MTDARQRLIDAMTDSDTCFCGADSCQNAEQYVGAYAHQLAEQIRQERDEANTPGSPATPDLIRGMTHAADLIDPEAQS